MCVMSDYLSRNELTQVDRAAGRATSAVPAVQQISGHEQPHARARHMQDGKCAEPDASTLSEDDLASAAEYAKVHVRVADILAKLRSEVNAPTLEGAEAEIQSLLPAPILLVPLPPASKEAVESALELGRRIAEQASYAHAAQAHLRRGTVDQILSAGV